MRPAGYSERSTADKRGSICYGVPMKAVYGETSTLSYLTARPSRDLLAVAHQQVTQTWWDFHQARFEVFVSQLVDEECRRGDPDAAHRRVEAIVGIPMLEVVEEAYKLAAALMAEGAVPASAQDDATHIALAAVHGNDYLLT